jgi:cell division protein FtsQ
VPANGLRGRLRVPVARVLVALVVVAACAGLAYGAARYTSLFALERIEVTGGTAPVRASVREAGAQFLGASLVSLDDDAVRARLTELPSVESVRLDRAFPHTLRIVVVPEEPLAVVKDGFGAWLVSRRGRVIRTAATEPRRAVVWTAQTGLEPGAVVGDENARLALEALRTVPAAFPERIESARAADGTVTLVLGDGSELRLGAAESLALKLAVAARVLRGMSAGERAGIGYLDVSVPERVVGGSSLYSQLEG